MLPRSGEPYLLPNRPLHALRLTAPSDGYGSSVQVGDGYGSSVQVGSSGRLLLQGGRSSSVRRDPALPPVGAGEPPGPCAVCHLAKHGTIHVYNTLPPALLTPQICGPPQVVEGLKRLE